MYVCMYQAVVDTLHAYILTPTACSNNKIMTNYVLSIAVCLKKRLLLAHYTHTLSLTAPDCNKIRTGWM